MNIVNFYAGDMKSVSEGGIASYIRDILKYSDNDISYSLVGVTKHNENKVGEWNKSRFGKVSFYIFPVLSVNDDHITYKKGVPLNARYLIKLFVYKHKILKVADSLHFHRIELALPFVVFRHKHIPAVVTIHGSTRHIEMAKSHKLFNKKWFRFMYYMLEKYVLEKVDKVIFVSSEGMNYYSNKYPKIRDKFVILPTFVDFDTFRPLEKIKCRNMFNLPINKKILLFVGRLHEQKDVVLLLDSYSILNNMSGEKYMFVIAGEGVEKRNLEMKIRSDNISNVEFIGNVDHNKIPELINVADVFVMASLWEGMPIVVLESLACNVPVVSTNVGQLNAIIKDGVNGFIVNNRSSNEIAKRIEDALSFDVNIRKQCRDSINDYNSENIVRKIWNLHYQLIKSAGKP